MSISKHTALNLVGAVLPIAVTLITVPLYLQVVGPERYGALSICWVLLGYLGFMDLGLGPAVSQKIAAAGDSEPEKARALFWTALWASLALSTSAAFLFFAGTFIYFSFVEPSSIAMREFKDAAPLIAAILPVAMVSGVAAGALHGRQRFFTMNVITATGSTLMSVLPLLIAIWVSPTLLGLVAGAIAARAIALLLSFSAVIRTLAIVRIGRIRPDLLRSLLSFGGWVTISTAAAPFLVTVDRLAVGAALGAAAVAAYSIPFSLISRLSILPGSLSSALYPRFAVSDVDERRRLARLAMTATAAVMTPIMIILIALVGPFFETWVGPELASSSISVTYALIIGTWTNSIASIPLTMLQGSGRPDIVAKIHLLEMLPYWALLAASLYFFGLVGAAVAWSLRASADCLLLFHRSGIGLRPLLSVASPLFCLAGALTALWLDGAPRMALWTICGIAAASWSTYHLPDAVRRKLGTFGDLLPRAAVSVER